MVEVIDYIVSLGASVMMPIIFFILALIVGVKPGQSFKAALTIGIGFVGLTTVINLLLDSLGPAANAMVDRMGINLSVLDSGWATASTVGWGFEFMVPLVVIFLVINFVMIATKLTNTVDIDVFNYWVFLTEGAMIYAMTGNLALTLVATAVLFAVMLKVADLTAPVVDEQYGLEGISFPHFISTPHALVGIIVNKVCDLVPGMREASFSAEKISEKLGVIGDPSTIGFILGVAIGLLAGYDAGACATLAIKVAAAMVLLPRMAGLLIEGLDIVKGAVEEKLAKIFPDRKFYIGMDVALVSGDPCVVAVGVLLIPISLLLAVVIPGNRVLPFVDLPSIIFDVTIVAAFCRRDMVRTLIAGTIMMAFIIFASNGFCDLYSSAALAAGATFPAGMDVMSVLNAGFTNPLGWIVLQGMSLFA